MMTKVGGLAFAAVSGAGALVLVVGCSSGAGPTVGVSHESKVSAAQTGPAAATTAPTSSSATSDDSTGLTFHAGQCLNDSPEWAPVSCDESHFYEVTAVVKDNKYAGNLLKRSAYRRWMCDQKANDYLGRQAFSTLLMSDTLPTAADSHHNDQIVCLVRHAKPADKGMVADRKSLKGALKGDGLFKYRVCMSTKASGRDLHLTSCNGPHVSEATWGFPLGKWGDPFPGVRQLNKTSLQKCQSKSKQFLGGVTRDDITFAQNSSSESGWKSGFQVTTCFVQVDHGKVEETMKDIKHKALSSIR